MNLARATCRSLSHLQTVFFALLSSVAEEAVCITGLSDWWQRLPCKVLTSPAQLPEPQLTFGPLLCLTLIPTSSFTQLLEGFVTLMFSFFCTIILLFFSPLDSGFGECLGGVFFPHL